MHSENREHAVSHFKRGFGYYPMFCASTQPARHLPGSCAPGDSMPFQKFAVNAALTLH